MKKMFEMAPSTKCPAKLLSRVYGYGSPRELAASLPDNAVVTDFGAGRSNFGETIVELRDDITWLNIDPRYTTANAQRAQRNTPAGLQYVAGDVLSPPLPSGSCDRVFSSALLPHIAMSSPDLALEAVHNMANLLREGGELAVTGFVNSPRKSSLELVTSTTAQEYHANPDLVASHMVDVISLPPILVATQGVANFIRHYSGINTHLS